MCLFTELSSSNLSHCYRETNFLVDFENAASLRIDNLQDLLRKVPRIKAIIAALKKKESLEANQKNSEKR